MKKLMILLGVAAVVFSGCGKAGSGVSSGDQPSPGPAPKSAQYVYVLNQADDSVGQYALGADGSLSPLTTPTIATGRFPKAIVTDATGKYIYVANTFDRTISQYEVHSDGTLASIGSPISLLGEFDR